jgi:hypothetical protein
MASAEPRFDCEICAHRTGRATPELPPDAVNGKLAKGLTRLHQLSIEQMHREQTIVAQGRPFEFQPFFYWCCARHSGPGAWEECESTWHVLTRDRGGHCPNLKPRGATQ